MYLCLSSSSDDSSSCCTAVWAQACGLKRKQVLSLSCIFGSFGVLDRFLLLLVCWWELYHDTATSVTDYSDLRNRDNFCSVCVGKHVTASRYCRFLCKTLRRWVPLLAVLFGVYVLPATCSFGFLCFRLCFRIVRLLGSIADTFHVSVFGGIWYNFTSFST